MVYIVNVYTSFTKDIKKLKQWLIDNNCKDVCMESTGKYWIPIFNILEDYCNVTITHPKYVKAIQGKKTDTNPEEILESVQGNLTHEQNSKMKTCLNHYDNILECIDQIEKAISPLLAPYQDKINLIFYFPKVLFLGLLFSMDFFLYYFSTFTSKI